MEKKLTITLRRSTIGQPQKQRLVAAGLGLTKLHKAVLREDTPQIRGMIYKIRHLVTVVEPS
jgi:large subunit ribosomal protein L30